MSLAGAAPTQENQPASRYAWLMTTGFLLYTAIVLAGHIIAFPRSYAFLQTVCAGSDDPLGAPSCGLTPENAHALAQIGVSVAWYANFYTTIQVIYILACLSVGILIVLKKPGQLVPLGMALLLVGLSGYEGADYPALAAAYPWLTLPVFVLINVIGMGPLSTYALLTFPNGKFAPRWVFWLFLVMALAGVIPTTTPSDLLNTVLNIVSLLSFPLMLFVLVYRFRHLLTAKERHAAKWVIYSLSIFIPSLVLALVVLPALAPADSLWFLVINTFGFFGCGVNLFGILMAILYANAFDIDVLINRTLVYGSLTALLAAVYAGLIIGLESLGSLFIGQDAQPLVVVISTLAIAALFQPLRRRVQNFIDRRFYRRKYDAIKALAAFSATLRNEVDLEQVNAQLLALINETMQPAHVSLWLRSSDAKPHQERAGE